MPEIQVTAPDLRPPPSPPAHPGERCLAMSTLRASPEFIRHVRLEGRDHLVVPAVLLTEGVIQGMGQAQPELALATEFADPPEAWNGRPVVIREHPQANGGPSSANDPALKETVTIGQIFNARAEDRSLKAEIWIDLPKARKVGPEAMAMIAALERGDQVEVSTGYWADSEATSGVHQGRAYSAVQRHVRPDHLLLVPLGEKGACSWEDGCGAPRLNQLPPCCDACGRGDLCERESVMDMNVITGTRLLFAGNRKMSDVDRRTAVESALQQGKEGGEIVALFDDAVIYHSFDPDIGFAMLRRGYEIGDGGVVTLAKAKQQVRPETRFVPVKANGAVETPPVDDGAATQNDPQETNIMEPTPAVTALIENQRSPFTETDAAWLAAAPADRIEALMTSFAEPEPAAPAATPEEPIRTVDDLLRRCADGDFRAFIQSGIRMAKDRKVQLIGQIMAHPDKVYGEDDLRTRDVPELERMVALMGETSAPTDFMGRGGVSIRAMTDDNPPPMPKLFAQREN